MFPPGGSQSDLPEVLLSSHTAAAVWTPSLVTEAATQRDLTVTELPLPEHSSLKTAD